MVNVIVSMGFVGIVNMIFMTGIVHLNALTKIVQFGKGSFDSEMRYLWF